ncbi:T9SS type A sorting domain-containing protein [Chitinophagaceae bacterium MMS25-I14]
MAQWSELGTGANALNANSNIRTISADRFSNLYAGGVFSNGAGNEYIAKWDGASWAELGSGAGALNANSVIWTSTTDKTGNVYAAGFFTNSANMYYVAKYSGGSWAELGGANSLHANNTIYSITSDTSGHIYASGDFTDSALSFLGHRYVAEWNGTNWIELGTGANALNPNNTVRSVLTDPAGNVYAAGDFTNSSGGTYVAKWNGSSWTELGGNNALGGNSSIYCMARDASGNIYAAGSFTNSLGETYVAKWNGVTWTELGGLSGIGTNSSIWALTTDAAGNVYAAGDFTGGAAGMHYVAKWDGSSWSELGFSNPLNANGYITSLVADASNNVYAGGAFTDSLGSQYVAKYVTPPVCNAPAGVTASAVMHASAIISWTAPIPAPANGYQYYYSTTNSAPVASTTPSGSVTATSAGLSGLTASTQYYVWVRSVCAASDTSAWSSLYTFTTTSGVGVSNATAAALFSIYPNPANDIITVNSTDNRIDEITVLNMQGQVTAHETPAATYCQLHLSGYASGIYTIRIRTNNKVVVQKIEVAK